MKLVPRLKENIDGEAILWAYQRLKKRSEETNTTAVAMICKVIKATPEVTA